MKHGEGMARQMTLTDTFALITGLAFYLAILSGPRPWFVGFFDTVVFVFATTWCVPSLRRRVPIFGGWTIINTLSLIGIAFVLTALELGSP